MSEINDVRDFLHTLRNHIVDEWHDEDTIVRIEVDEEVERENVHLIIIAKDLYQPIRLDPGDEMNQNLIDFCKRTFQEGLAHIGNQDSKPTESESTS